MTKVTFNGVNGFVYSYVNGCDIEKLTACAVRNNIAYCTYELIGQLEYQAFDIKIGLGDEGYVIYSSSDKTDEVIMNMLFYAVANKELHRLGYEDFIDPMSIEEVLSNEAEKLVDYIKNNLCMINKEWGDKVLPRYKEIIEEPKWLDLEEIPF